VRKHPFLIISLAFFILLAACGPKTTPTPEATSVPPTGTPEPTSASPLAILILPGDMPLPVSQEYQSAVYDLAQSSGYRFQVRNSLSPEQAASEPGLEIVIALPPDPGMAALAAAAPDVQFLAVDIPGVTAGGNVSAIGGGENTFNPAPFLAGYISAMLSEDWRTGLIVEKDAQATPGIEAAFGNGTGFYCGICNPVAPPYYEYPLAVEMPADSSGGEAIAYGDYLVDHQANVVYIAPSVADAGLINDLVSRGVLMIGETPPPQGAGSGWIATIQPDWLSAIAEAWPKLIAGEGSFSQPSPISLTDVNPDLLTPGKQRLAEETLARLANGEIDTGAQP
jgi:hypothetical protein